MKQLTERKEIRHTLLLAAEQRLRMTSNAANFFEQVHLQELAASCVNACTNFKDEGLVSWINQNKDELSNMATPVHKYAVFVGLKKY